MEQKLSKNQRKNRQKNLIINVQIPLIQYVKYILITYLKFFSGQTFLKFNRVNSKIKDKHYQNAAKLRVLQND